VDQDLPRNAPPPARTPWRSHAGPQRQDLLIRSAGYRKKAARTHNLYR